MERLPDWQIALRRLDMEPMRFITVYMGSAGLMGFVTGLMLMLIGLFSGLAGIFVILIFTTIS